MSIYLERLEERHLAAVARICDDPDVLRYTLIPDPLPDDFPREWFAGYERSRADGTGEAFAIVDPGVELLGLALVPHLDRTAGEAELGYLVAASARGRGVATEAVRQLTEWAFEQAGLQRLELYISVGNEASRKVAARAGYTFEAVLRQIYVKPGLREDNELWSRLPSDQ